MTGSSRSLSSPVRGVVEDLHAVQEGRSNRLYHPMSSPIRNRPEIRGRTGKSAGANKRDKHDKLRIARERFREEMLASKRENVTGLQSQQDYEKQFEEQSKKYADVEIDELLNEEKELQQEMHHNRNPPVSNAPASDRPTEGGPEEEQYQQELEEFLRLDQLEMEELLSHLEIG